MSANLTTNILTQIAYKRLSGKAMSSGRSSLAAEALGSTVQSSATTIFGQVVPNAPVSASDGSSIYKIQSASVSDPGTVQLVKFNLTVVPGTSYGTDVTGMNIDALKKDPSGVQDARTISPLGGFDQGIGQAGSTSTFHAYSISLPGDYVVQSTNAGFGANASTPKTLGTDAPFTNGFMSTGSVQMQVVPEFLSTVTGTSNTYIPKVIATNGAVMDTNSPIDYYFDAMAGILFVQDPQAAAGTNNNAAVPEFIEAFLYVGRYQSEIEGDSVDLHFSASEGTGFSFANNATASFTSGSGGGLTVTAGATNNIEFELVNVISGSEQVQDSLDGVSLFRISSSTGTDDIDLQFGQTASFEDGGAGLTVKATGNTSKTVEIGAATDNVTFNQITGSDLIITNTASISYLETIYETSSIIYSSGSTKFGNTLDDFHNFTGSIELSSSGLDGFTWDTPSGSDVTIPLVYDANTKRVLTGSDYFKKNEFGIHISASEGSGFSLTNLSTASFTSGSGGGLTVTAGSTNNIEFELVGVVSSSEQILDGTGILSSSTQDFATYSSSVETLITNATASITNNETDITNATASIAALVLSASAGIAVSSSGGTTSIPLTETASFIGGTGITITNSNGEITIDSDTGELSSPFQIRTGSSAVGTSIAYGGTASFAASGTGLAVDEASGTVTYTVDPAELVESVDTATVITITASYAESASVATSASYALSASHAETADSTINVEILGIDSDALVHPIVFTAADKADNPDNGVTEDEQLATDKNHFTYEMRSGKITTSQSASPHRRLQITPQELQSDLGDGSVTIYNVLTTDSTLTTINMGVAPGSVNFLGSASIAGDLIVNGTTTTLNTQNLLVEDRYILLGSSSADNNVGGGIVVQKATTGIGTALHWDDVKEVWAVEVAGADAQTATAKAVDGVVVFASHSAGNPSGTPLVGASANYQLGQMYLDTADTDSDGNTIWIYAT